MHMYLYATPDTAERKLFSPTLLDLASLWHRGFLDDSSTVWVNADRDSSRFWALTDRSQFVFVIAQPTPGFIRVTKSSVRWARSFDASVDNPVITEDISELPGGVATNVTVIAKHTCAERPVTVINGGSGKSVPLSEDGTAEIGNVTVIDWPRFVQRPLDQPEQYEVVNAELHGIEFLRNTVDPSAAELIRKHMMDYRVEVKPEDFTQINVMLDRIDTYSQQLIEYVYARIDSGAKHSKGNHSKAEQAPPDKESRKTDKVSS
jgi:hypothetical protein